LAVAVFWLWWGVGSAHVEGFTWGSLLAHSAPGLLILIAALVAWKWERVGGGLLVGVAALVTAFIFWAISRGGYRGGYQVAAMVWLTMALPPLVAGALFLAERGK
jgi:hypothetical protein